MKCRCRCVVLTVPQIMPSASPFLHQHRADQRRAAAHFELRHLRADALARHHLVIRLPEVAITLVVIGIDDGEVHARRQTQAVTS